MMDKPSEPLLSLLDLCATKCPERTHSIISGSSRFWTAIWELSSDDEGALTALLAFVQRFIITAESLTTDLLRMVLVDHRETILKALNGKRNTVVIQALILLQTLALCKHEVICEALVGSR